MKSHVEELYKRIQANPEHTQALFRQALQDPKGAMKAICDFGQSIGLSVTEEEVKTYLSQIGDSDTKQWIIKARGGL